MILKTYSGWVMSPAKKIVNAALQSHALIEGDASLTEYNWYFQYATEQDQSDIQTFYESFQSPVYDSSPEFMKVGFSFPIF